MRHGTEMARRRGIALAAVAELAQSYMQLRGTQSRLGIAKRNLHLAEENVELVNTRFANGTAATLDLAQARSQQATIAATLPPLRTQEAEIINAVGLLLGDAPRALEAELHRPRILPRVPRKPSHRASTRMSNCIKIESFGATDISATLGSGINMSRVESCCTRLLLESKAGSVLQITRCSGRFGEKLGGRFSKNRFVLSRRSEF